MAAVLFPWDELSVEIWGERGAIQFRGSVRQRDCKVLDNGSAAVDIGGERT